MSHISKTLSQCELNLRKKVVDMIRFKTDKNA